MKDRNNIKTTPRWMRLAFFSLGLILLLSHDLALCAAESQTSGTVIRVLTYNIHHGAGMDGKINLGRIAEVIKAARPDLVALQEVDRQSRRAGGVDQAAKLGELTGMNVVFGKAMDFDGGQYGLALLAKVPLQQTQTDPLPAGKGFESRALLQATVQPAAGRPKIIFFGTHLDEHRDPKQRQQQAARILELTGNATVEPLIIAGDFNARPEDPALLSLLKQWTDPVTEKPFFTCPSDQPAERIDYVLYRPADRFRLVEAKVLDEKIASDHRPVLTVLELVKAK